MKRTLTLFAYVAICCAMMVSCKNAKTTEPTPEEIQQQKQALADSVLAQIDAFVDEFIQASEKGFHFDNLELTEEEKKVKPDYLLEPSFASTLVTKSQKVNALAIYIVDCAVRKIYGMPLYETKEVIAKLAIELNHANDDDFITDYEMPESEIIKKEYEICKDRGDLAYFWQFHYAFVSEMSYIVSNNPELFFSKITEEQWQAFISRFMTVVRGVEKVASYDDEMSQLWKFRNKYNPSGSDEQAKCVNQTKESAKQFRIVNKDKYIARRNALLQ